MVFRKNGDIMSHRGKWLGWLAFLIFFFGGLIAYMISLQETNPDAQANMVLTLAITAALAGICLICMSADWWMRH